MIIEKPTFVGKCVLFVELPSVNGNHLTGKRKGKTSIDHKITCCNICYLFV